MSYAPPVDFLALLRQVSSGVELARMPSLDFAVAALARANLFRLWVGQSAPISSQANTVWLRPALPSWTAEGVVFLWDADTAAYAAATPALWARLLFAASSSYVFQSVRLISGVVDNVTTMLAVERASPATTLLTLPALASRGPDALSIVDWSTSIVSHVITLITPDGATVMQSAAWNLYSTPNQLSSVTLRPVIELNGWVIAP